MEVLGLRRKTRGRAGSEKEVNEENMVVGA